MRVSVVIPCFNGERFLAQAIRSVLEQSFSPLDVVVVDDGSTDSSRSIACRFGDLVVLHETSHAGARAARNTGARLACGEAIMFLDADDVLGPGVLEALVSALRREPAGIALGPWRRLVRDEDGEEGVGRWVSRPPSCARRVPGDDELASWLTGWYHPPCAVLWSRTAFDLAGGWDETLRPGLNDDGDIMMRALARNTPVVYAEDEDAVSYYRRNPHGSRSSMRNTQAGLKARLYVLARLADELERHGTMDRYQLPMTLALEAVASDAEAVAPQVADACRQVARVRGGPRWRNELHLLARGARMASASVSEIVLGSLAVVKGADQRPAHEEVSFGLDRGRDGRSAGHMHIQEVRP